MHLRRVRQNLRLFVVHILQGMFDVAQKNVISREPYGRFGRKGPMFSKFGKHRESPLPLQSRLPPTADNLKSLRDEFDFADAAASQLHVAPRFFSRFTPRRFRADHFVKSRKSADRRKVHIFAEHKGTNQVVKPRDRSVKRRLRHKNGGVHHAAL